MVKAKKQTNKNKKALSSNKIIWEIDLNIVFSIITMQISVAWYPRHKTSHDFGSP